MDRATLKHGLRFAALTIISSLVSYCALAGSTVTASREYVNRKFDAATNYVDSATNDVLVAAQGYTDEKISEISAPDFSTNNVELVETIEMMAPPPGDYAAVSNAAVHAAITNALQDAALESKLDKSGGIVTGDLAIGPNSNYSAKFESDPSGAVSLTLYDSIDNTLVISGGKLFYKRYDWQVGIELFFPSTDGTLALAASNPTAGNLAALDAQGNPTDSGLSKDDVDNLLFAQYYPEGNVKSAAEFTAGIKYDDPDTTARTITVKPFCDTGTAANDNSSLVGRVVIPPFVDASGNGYISDDGTRYKVSGIASPQYTREPDAQTNTTGIVAPTTVLYVGDGSFSGCAGLVSASFPAAETVDAGAFDRCASLVSMSLPDASGLLGDNVFWGCTSLRSVYIPRIDELSEAFMACTSLESVDFGGTPRQAVPTLSPYTFDGVPISCKFIVPDAQYDEWVAAPGWSDLVAAGYKFLRHSEWEYVRKYELVRRYPMFVIDLNPDDQRIWNHFELKASTNNFTNTTSANMLFFTASTVNGVTNAEFDVGYPYDWCRLYILSGRAGGGAADPRSWTRIRNTAELDTYAPLAVAVIVDMEMLKRGQGSEWLYEDNEEIVWSYLRIGLDSAERDQTGAQCWRPVSPVRWYRKLPQWAEQECTSFSTSGIRPYGTPLDGYE